MKHTMQTQASKVSNNSPKNRFIFKNGSFITINRIAKIEANMSLRSILWAQQGRVITHHRLQAAKIKTTSICKAQQEVSEANNI